MKSKIKISIKVEDGIIQEVRSDTEMPEFSIQVWDADEDFDPDRLDSNKNKEKIHNKLKYLYECY